MIKSGLVTDIEARALMELAAMAPGIIVEIGSYTGKSTVALLSAGKPVYAIDLWDLHLPGEKAGKARNKKSRAIPFNSRAAFKEFIQNTEGFENLIWVKANSHEVAKVWNHPIGGLFIDGAHDAKSVRADYLGFGKHVVPGGFIAFHDAHQNNGVVHVIDNLVMPDEAWGNWDKVERLAIAYRRVKTEVGSEAEAPDSTAASAVPDDEGPPASSSEAEPGPSSETPPATRRPRRTAKKDEEEVSDEV